MIGSVDFIEPFLIYTPNESGMSESELASTGLQAGEVNGAVKNYLAGEASEDDVNDRLRAIGIEPVEYWSDVETELLYLLNTGASVSNIEITESGLVIPR